MLNYLALGDSYTIGELVDGPQNFPNQLVTLLQNKGLPISQPHIIATTGWTTDELNTAIQQQNISQTYSFVTLLIGVNNQYRGRDLQNYNTEFTQLLQQAIHFAAGNTQHVFVLSIPDWGATPFAQDKDGVKIALEIDDFNNVAQSITLGANCHFLNITDSTRLNAKDPSFLATDGLHPSAKEYEIWATRLAPFVMKAFN